MRRGLLVIIVFISSIGSTWGQFNVYHPFPDSNAYWVENSTGSTGTGFYCEEYGYKLIGDTIVNGITHCKLYKVGDYYEPNCLGGTLTHTISFYGALYADTMKQVYLCCTGDLKSLGYSHKDTLIYDFSLKKGDSLYWYNSTSFNGKKNYVSNIDSILIGSSYRKQFIISTTPASVIDSIVEGIGSMEGVVEGEFPVFEFGCHVTCFLQNGDFLIQGDSCPMYGPVNIWTGIPSYQGNMLCGLAINPNPAENVIKISYKVPDGSSACLQLFNSFGQLLKTEKLEAANLNIEDNVSGLANGIYYYMLQVNGLDVSTHKLVVIH